VLKVLEPSNPEWAGYLDRLPAKRRDIHFAPPLFHAYEAWGQEVSLLVEDDGTNFTMWPVVIGADGAIRNAYNFGGPTWSRLNTEQLGALRKSLRTMRQLKGGMFHCIYNPFLEEHRLLAPDSYIKDVVYIDLDDPSPMRGTTRRVIRDAHKNCEIYRVTQESLPLFEVMYAATMNRRIAANHWYFPHSWFQTLCDRLGDRAVLVMGYVDGELEASSLTIYGDNGVAYYAFAGSMGKFPKSGVNNLMIDQVAKLVKSLGCNKLCLGGGVSPGDSLEKFKAGFSELRAPVYVDIRL
jgi:hypothetical protein